jgi:hypothetical protein
MLRNYGARILGLSAAIAALGMSSATSALAQSWNGPQPGTISGFGGLAFDSTTDTFTWTRDAASSGIILSVPTASVPFTSKPLLGIRGFWIVDASGGSVAGTVASSGEGTVTDGTHTSTYTTENGPAGYYGDNGFGNGKNWLPLVSASTLSTYGLSSSNPYTSGSFEIPGMAAVIAANTHYDIGIDYIVGLSPGNTTTGRTYLAPPTFPKPPTTVPEPGAVALVAGVLPLLGAGIRRRR